MAQLNKLAKLLGEENEKRLKSSITDLLIEQVSDELRDNYDFLIDYEYLFNEVIDEIKEEFKNRVREKYMGIMDEKFSELFETRKSNGRI